MESKDIIKSLRKKRNYSAQQVADGYDMSLGVYRKYETGERGIGVPTLQKLADFYNVTTDYLLGRETPESSTVDKLSSEFNMTALERKILEGYLELPDNMRENLMEFLQKSVQEVQEEN